MSDKLSEERLEEVNGGCSDSYYYYTVEPGDTLYKLVIKFGISGMDIIILNRTINLEEELKPGSVLRLPGKVFYKVNNL